MARAVEAASAVRSTTSPNPWVGCVLVGADGGLIAEGATQPPGGPHAEAVGLAAAGSAAAGATAYVTLEPCAHHGRTGPCADALVDAGVARVVAAVRDPDSAVAGRGFDRLRQAGIEVTEGVLAERVERQLAPYLHSRRTGRPYVVLKLAATLDGRTAAPDGSSRWITGPDARADVHRLRAESDAVLVGAGTVRADDPALTVREAPAPGGDPLRVVLGKAPDDAQVRPCLERTGDLLPILEELGEQGCLQLLVEGGATVAADFHRAGLVDRYVLYLAPALLGGNDGHPLFSGRGASTMRDAWRGDIDNVTPLGPDLRIDLLSEEDADKVQRRSRQAEERERRPAWPGNAGALMFTGIVEELGTVLSRDGGRFRFGCRTVLDDAELGASIAVNGCCLTVIDWDADEGWWDADVTGESLTRTNLDLLSAGDRVNLERPVRLADRLGGHLVQGHVDGVGEVLDPAARSAGPHAGWPGPLSRGEGLDHR